MNTSVPISIHEWIHSARKLPRTTYIESSVNLAWVLTKHICHTIAASPEVKLEDHISTENIVLFSERPWLAPHGHAIFHAPLVTDVKFQFEMDAIVYENLKNKTQPHCPLSVCAALGILLLEIFSMGRCSSLQNIPKDASNFEEKTNYSRTSSTDFNSDCGGESNCDVNPPQKKLQSTLPKNGSMSTTAKNLLCELGTPLSICRLIIDLMDAKNVSFSCTNPAFESLKDLFIADNNKYHTSPLTSVKETFWDLTQMKTRPHLFLFDRTCPKIAVSDTCLFASTDKHLIGREREISALMSVKDKVSAHVRTEDSTHDSILGQGSNFLCETAILSGYAGCGKSSIINFLTSSCKRDNWFVLGCKFDKHTAGHMILAKAFDDFFGKWHAHGNHADADVDPLMQESFHQVCRIIFSDVDGEGFDQLCRLIPNFAKEFPLLAMRANHQDQDGISSMDKVGSAKNRLLSLFNVLFKSICSVGRPVLFIFDDLQWSQPFVMEAITEFAINYAHDTTPDSSKVSSKNSQQGLLIAGTYRSNEVQDEDNLIKSIKFMNESGKAKVTTLNVKELTKADVTRLISAKLCLPWRYTQELAGLVQRKTRGNPFFIAQFLKSLIQNHTLQFSVKSRRWEWDCDVVDMQMISDGVAELLTSTFSCLPDEVMQVVKIASCLGSQLEESTVDALNSRNEFLPFNMHTQLALAVEEGIMEKAGPVYQFTHDIIQHTIYELIPEDNREILHKTIGKNLLRYSGNNNALHLLATDQINIFCKGIGCNPSDDERAQFVECNAKAAKVAIAASSFMQAQSYIDAGLQLLEAQHWESQYCLSLNLYEMSASVSCINGDISTMSSRLDEILSHCRKFDDSLKASSLLVKLLMSLSKFEEARSNCLTILSNLGEIFPIEVNHTVALREITEMKRMLKHISKDQIKSLPPMTNKDKIAAMKFLNMLCMYSVISKPLLLPLLSSRMMKLTMEYGFCADSTVGLATAGYSIFIFTDENQLASNIGKVCESLVEESPMKHVLRSRLCNELFVTLKMIKEPWPCSPAIFFDLYESAMLSGDIENAMMCRFNHCCGLFRLGLLDLSSVSKYAAVCIKEMAKYKQNTMLYSTMGVLNSCSQLSGIMTATDDFDLKSSDELQEMGEKTNNVFLTWQSFNQRMIDHFWKREFMVVADLSKKFSEKHPSSPPKRILQVMRCFFEGIAYLNIARDTRQIKWRILGEKAVIQISENVSMMSEWNFKNKSLLLWAELHYLDGDIKSADASYRASIKSAHDHKFLHEEALGLELYGIFLVEIKMAVEGMHQLQLAIDKYTEWGAIKKAGSVKEFSDMVGEYLIPKEHLSV